MQGVVSSQQARDANALDEPEVVSREHHDDVALALALSQAARTVEHVVDVSAGRYGVAATYGPGQRVTGIVLRRAVQSGWDSPLSFVVEAHIVVAAAAVTVPIAPHRADPKPSREKRQRQKTSSTREMSSAPRAPVLLRIADETRHTLAAALRRLRPGETWEIDITIDELRDTGARDASQVQ
jgi:hypothetical protein